MPIPSGFKNKEEYAAYMRGYVKKEMIARKKRVMAKAGYMCENHSLRIMIKLMLTPQFRSMPLDEQVRIVRGGFKTIDESVKEIIAEAAELWDNTIKKFEVAVDAVIQNPSTEVLKNFKMLPEVDTQPLPSKLDVEAYISQLVKLKEKDVKKNLNHGVV